MITEQAKDAEQIKKIQAGITLCEEALAKAEKYERIKDNKDWQMYLEDLKVLADLHDREIKMAESALLDASNSGYVKKDDFGKDVYVSSKQDWVDFIVRHQIQKEEALKWVKEPEHILLLAAMSRQKLPLLKEKLAELTHAPATNGKS